MCLIFDVCQSSTSIIIISLFRSLNQRFLEFRRNLGTFCNTIVDKSQGILIFLYSSSAFIRGVLIAKIFGWVGLRYYHVYIFASRTNTTRLNPSDFTFHYKKPVLNGNSCALEMSGSVGEVLLGYTKRFCSRQWAKVYIT